MHLLCRSRLVPPFYLLFDTYKPPNKQQIYKCMYIYIYVHVEVLSLISIQEVILSCLYNIQHHTVKLTNSFSLFIHYSFIHSFIHPFIHTFIHPFILPFFHPFILLFILLFIHLFILLSFLSFIHSFILLILKNL